MLVSPHFAQLIETPEPTLPTSMIVTYGDSSMQPDLLNALEVSAGKL